MKKYLTLIVVLLTLCSCDNYRTRILGGSMSQEIPQNEKLVNITWKGTELWILTRERRQDEFAESYTFKEKSSFGIIEGTISIKEK